MSTTQKKPPAARKERTAAEVIGMFEGLTLPVTDDGRQIDAKRKELQKRYLREKGSTDGQRRAKADLWFKNADLLQKDRPALLAIVRNHFTHLADTTLEAALSVGVHELTQQLCDKLERFALEECKCDPPLAQAFFEEYLHARGLKRGGATVFPHLVEQLTVDSSPGQVKLHWKLPGKDCDEVIVQRFETTKDGRFKKTGKELCRGKRASYTDGTVQAGRRYQYRVYSVLSGAPSRNWVQVEPVAVGEVAGVEARWEKDHVKLSWRKPASDCEVLIFRASSVIAPVQSTPLDPLPANPEAELIYRGTQSKWQDQSVVEGRTYHYLLVASFASSYYANGVRVSIRTPTPPRAVKDVSAEYVDGVVRIGWEPVGRPQRVEYLVVRRQGSVSPEGVDDGNVVETTRNTHYLDAEVVAGHRYTYAVFTRVEALHSRTGTPAPPVDILAEVTELSTQTGDGTVELHWQTPANVSQVIVRRGEDPPADHTGGRLVRLSGTDYAKDEGLDNGRRYHYLVCCAYRPTGTTEAISPGVRISAVPNQLPDPVEDFDVQVRGLEVQCTWSPPAYGQTVVLRSANPHGLPLGQRLPVGEMDRLGSRITTERSRAQDIHPDLNTPYYSVFTVAGEHAIVGGTGCGVVYPDVTDLKLSATRDGVILRWVWPEECKAVLIARRANTWPEGPSDLKVTSVLYTLSEYRNAGEKFEDKIQQGRWQYYYVVYAQAPGVSGQFFALGAETGCRAVIQWEPWMTLRYRLASPDKRPHKGQEIHLTWRVEKPFPNFAGFVLVAKQDEPPSALDDGVALFRWTPKEGQAEGAHEAWVSLAPIQQRRWARFFCKAIVTDPAQRHATLIIHPNTGIPISEKGEMEVARRDGAGRTYRVGVPRTVICPYCFEEFPIGQMLFTSSAGEEPRVAQYTWFDRLLRRPLRLPVIKGRRLTRKLCPNHRHELPFTAGTQGSLVIGVIGAKFSGKSHYIAALVERLAGQVGSDLQADLLPVTDETSDRYQREFYDPLFGKGLELRTTAGTPPPLIYDLYLDGRLWGEQRNRAVTLAFYDTAGENLNDPNTVRRMVQYLRVASGIMFLIDPLQSPEVREAMPPSVPLPDRELMAEPDVVISNVLTELENGKIVAESGPLSIPVAVVLTKCDVLRDAGLMDPNRLWSSDKRHVGYFDLEAHNDMAGMMGEYVMRWSRKTYNRVQRRFSRHAFFGVSATGCASDKTTRRYKYISPWRVEDPLLWLLAELGVIPTR